MVETPTSRQQLNNSKDGEVVFELRWEPSPEKMAELHHYVQSEPAAYEFLAKVLSTNGVNPGEISAVKMRRDRMTSIERIVSSVSALEVPLQIDAISTNPLQLVVAGLRPTQRAECSESFRITNTRRPCPADPQREIPGAGTGANQRKPNSATASE